MTSRSADARVTFLRVIEEARLPQRADRAAIGTLPIRAARYCDAITTASAFGWYLFPPMDLNLMWDGSAVFWTYGDVADWMPLETAQFPGLSERFDAEAPESARGCSPPFLGALPEPGVVQIWSGLFARSAPGWSLLVRPLANLPRSGGFDLYEGIVETDRWFGPLFTNLRLTRTHSAIRLKRDFPFAQLQPLPRAAYAEQTLEAFDVVPRMADFDPADWDDYVRTIVRPNDDPDRPPGGYAVAARRRRKGTCPVNHSGGGETVAG